MERWAGKVAVVIGASAGIGASVLKDLLQANLKVVGLARRSERTDAIRPQFTREQQERLFTVKCDVTNENSVKKAFEWIHDNLGGTDILINSAGVLRLGNLIDSNSTLPAREIMETNIMGVMYCTREAFQQMKARQVDGHIIVINSLAGHHIPEMHPTIPMFNMYFASKFAVTAMVESYRQEFLREGTRVKMTSISPGAVDTEIFPDDFRSAVPHLVSLKPEDVSSAVLYALSTPNNVQIKEIMLEAIPDPKERKE